MDKSALQLPSPEKQSLFIYHSEFPGQPCRIPFPESWDGFLEVVRSRLKLLNVDGVFDASTGNGNLSIAGVWMQLMA